MWWALAAVAVVVARWAWPPLAEKVEDAMTATEFLKKIAPLAKTAELKWGIHKTIVVTQAAHESNWGRSKLTAEANNLFGITGEGWRAQGKPVYEIATKEFSEGRWITLRRPFRAYTSWWQSIDDWARELSSQPRYASAYKAAQEGNDRLYFVLVARAGYATDPRYAEKLMDVRAAVGEKLLAIA